MNSSKITDAGTNSDLIDRAGELSDLEDRVDNSLPGSHRGGDPSERRTRPESELLLSSFLLQQLHLLQLPLKGY